MCYFVEYQSLLTDYFKNGFIWEKGDLQAEMKWECHNVISPGQKFKHFYSNLFFTM